MTSSEQKFRAAPLDESQRGLIEQAREKAHILYEGKVTPHRSCGVCLAETFGLGWKPFQALRRGGLTGEGTCGAIRAGEMILGELLGPDTPTGAVDDRLREAIGFYQARWKERQSAAGWSDTICNTLTAPQGDFYGAQRVSFCTSLAVAAAALVAETLVRAGYEFEIVPFVADPT